MENSSETKTNGLSYKDAGVDIDAGNELVKIIAPLAKATNRAGSMGSLGGFGGLFDLKAAGFKDPILVSGTDGVGTKLEIAIDTKTHNTIGQDLVAMCVNDVLAQGAQPLFFLDYFACSKLDIETAAQVIAGIADGCKLSDCALIGGETAEMPGMYDNDKYDLAGFCVAAAERDALLPIHDKMRAGDILIGLSSSGPHSNGYSLIRKIVALSGLEWNEPCPFEEGKTLAQALLAPTKIYVKSVMPLIKDNLIKGLAHITGGGLTENAPRMLPDNLKPVFDYQAWDLPPVFKWLQEIGNVQTEEMHRTFNCGIGVVLCVDANQIEEVLSRLLDAGEDATIIGQLAAV
jgi:phosphoribosylformylglycinamidine cyclo-ligase